MPVGALALAGFVDGVFEGEAQSEISHVARPGIRFAVFGGAFELRVFGVKPAFKSRCPQESIGGGIADIEKERMVIGRAQAAQRILMDQVARVLLAQAIARVRRIVLGLLCKQRHGRKKEGTDVENPFKHCVVKFRSAPAILNLGAQISLFSAYPPKKKRRRP